MYVYSQSNRYKHRYRCGLVVRANQGGFDVEKGQQHLVLRLLACWTKNCYAKEPADGWLAHCGISVWPTIPNIFHISRISSRLKLSFVICQCLMTFAVLRTNSFFSLHTAFHTFSGQISSYMYIISAGICKLVPAHSPFQILTIICMWVSIPPRVDRESSYYNIDTTL